MKLSSTRSSEMMSIILSDVLLGKNTLAKLFHQLPSAYVSVELCFVGEH